MAGTTQCRQTATPHPRTGRRCRPTTCTGRDTQSDAGRASGSPSAGSATWASRRDLGAARAPLPVAGRPQRRCRDRWTPPLRLSVMSSCSIVSAVVRNTGLEIKQKRESEGTNGRLAILSLSSIRIRPSDSLFRDRKWLGIVAQLPNRLHLRSPSIVARCNPRAPSVLNWNGREAGLRAERRWLESG